MKKKFELKKLIQIEIDHMKWLVMSDGIIIHEMSLKNVNILMFDIMYHELDQMLNFQLEFENILLQLDLVYH
jgi:hypothetical protein